MAFVKPDLSEPQRMILGQRKIVCAPAGCSLMGLAKKPLDTASVPEKHNRLDATDTTRQLPTCYCPADFWRASDLLSDCLRRCSW